MNLFPEIKQWQQRPWMKGPAPHVERGVPCKDVETWVKRSAPLAKRQRIKYVTPPQREYERPTGDVKNLKYCTDMSKPKRGITPKFKMPKPVEFRRIYKEVKNLPFILKLAVPLRPTGKFHYNDGDIGPKH
jgi:hypothetical protein